MGIEHRQMESLNTFSHGLVIKPVPAEMSQDGRKSPNQKFLAAAVSLCYGKQEKDKRLIGRANADALNLFKAMRTVGHQAINSRYGNEQMCCDPHSELWHVPILMILKETGNAEVKSNCINFYEDHFAVMKHFWTPKGFRSPGSRAKNPGGMPLLPN